MPTVAVDSTRVASITYDKRMQSEPIRVFQTLEHPCGYYPDRQAQNLVFDPLAPRLDRLYAAALEWGFRRSGGHVYRPQCRQCRRCVPARIAVAQFRADRSQRRCRARNADLQVAVVEPARSEENFALYRRYLAARHADGGMDNPDSEDFDRFLFCAWSPTRFIEFRQRQRLLAVAVTDWLPNGLSSVYTFFEPEAAERGLGTFAILSQIDLAIREERTFLYLGYWIEGHPKMAYKSRFQPLELLREGRWQAVCAP